MAARLETFPAPIHALNNPAVKKIRRANIATNKIFKTVTVIRSDSTVKIIGDRCPNLAKNYPHWRKLLVKWLKKGACIQYLLLSKNKVASDAFTKIIADQKNEKGRLEVYFLRTASLPTHVKILMTEWKTFHFAVFAEPKQLWIETHHSPTETFARKCYFVPQEVAEKMYAYDLYSKQFDQVVSKYSTRFIPKTIKQKKSPLLRGSAIKQTNGSLVTASQLVSPRR